MSEKIAETLSNLAAWIQTEATDDEVVETFSNIMPLKHEINNKNFTSDEKLFFYKNFEIFIDIIRMEFEQRKICFEEDAFNIFYKGNVINFY